MKSYSASDYYATLGVPASATAGEIRTAFRKLALKYHPDRNKGSDEAAQRFIQASNAYETLGDADKRRMYDRMGSAGSDNGFGGFGFGGFDSSDFFAERTGRAERKQPQFSDYILMDIAPTYARGVHTLRAACVAENNLRHPKYIQRDGSSIYRPFTFKEDIVARLTDFNTLTNPDGSARSLDDRLIVSSLWNDSCTGIVKKAHTTKFKIVPLCKELIMIDEAFNAPFLPALYNSFDVQELDSGNGTYNHWLPKDKIVEQEGWRFALEEDVPLLRNYVDMVVTAIELRRGRVPERAMGFFVEQNPTTDKCGALFVADLDGSSNANGDSDLGNNGSFVRVAQSKFFSIEDKG